MPIKLLAPGTRHGNRFWYAVVTVKGRRCEISTRTRNKSDARRVAEQLEQELWHRRVLGSRPARTVAEGIEAYIAFRTPGRSDRRYLERLKDQLGHLAMDKLGQDHFDTAAQVLYPGCDPGTLNRQAYTPLQSVLRHAGITVRVRRPRQRKPRNRAISREHAELLIANASDPDLAALLTVLFFSGCRIGEAMSLTPDRVDLQRRRIRFNLSKTDEDHWRPMHERVFVALANLPRRDDRVFRWRTTSGPRKPLRALCRRLGLVFTPHVARHSFATWLVDAGVNLRDVMDAGGWSDHKSVFRYVGSNVERVRKAVDQL